MGDIIKSGPALRRGAGDLSDDDARAEFADEPFKLELIGLEGAAARRRTRRP